MTADEPHLERADAMARRLLRTAQAHGIADADAARVADTFARVVRDRWPAIGREGHPDHLHPARTALILLDDEGVARPVALRAALLHDSLRPELVPAPDRAAALAGANAAALLATLPPPGLDHGELAEHLVTAPRDTLLIALAERLDHARHLHLRHDTDADAFLAGVLAVYLPLAQRVGGTIRTRYERWTYAFRKRRRGARPGQA